MIVDGGAIARSVMADVSERIKETGEPPRLVVFALGSDLATETFVGIKQKMGAEAGIPVALVALPPESTTEDLADHITKASSVYDGIIIQLPLPEHIDQEKVFAILPQTHDVDVLGKEGRECFERGEHIIMPPVVAACAEILKREEYSLSDKKVVVVGKGRLVGNPARFWAEKEGAHVVSLDKDDGDIKEHTNDADVIVLGAGTPKLLKKDMISEGVIILDAGTSEDAGELSGDAAAECAEKAHIYTPVPGGIGPVAVSMIFKNLMQLHEQKGK